MNTYSWEHDERWEGVDAILSTEHKIILTVHCSDTYYPLQFLSYLSPLSKTTFKSCTISPLFRLIIKQKFILRFYFKFIVCCSLQTQEIFLMSPVWYKCQITIPISFYADSKFNFGHLEIKFHNLKLNTDHNLSCCFKMKALCYHYDNINPHLNQVPFLLKYKILNLLAKKSTNIQFIMCLIIFSISVWILQCTSLSKAKNCL